MDFEILKIACRFNYSDFTLFNIKCNVISVTDAFWLAFKVHFFCCNENWVPVLCGLGCYGGKKVEL